MDRIKNQSKRYSALFCLITIVILCIFVIYGLSVAQIMSVKDTVQHSFKSTLSSQQLCYSSGNGVFIRDHLRKLDINTFHNDSAYMNTSDALKQPSISQNYSTLTEFIVNSREAYMSRRLKPNSRSIPTIFHHPPFKDIVRPSCDGLWMEFGVYQGGTLSIIANWKALYCGNTSQSVYGFDTFQGLPTDWRPGFSRGTFRISDERILKVPYNTELVKGLFIDTLSIHLRSMDDQFKCHTPVSFVHIDCDIYDGTRDVLFLLGSRFVSGTIIVFDELFNYPNFEKHEIKALYELLSSSNLQLIPLGSSSDIDLKPTQDKPIQSFGFVVGPQENL
jgi:hypothetical protein